MSSTYRLLPGTATECFHWDAFHATLQSKLKFRRPIECVMGGMDLGYSPLAHFCELIMDIQVPFKVGQFLD
jgi:hypothetical protein